MDTFTWIPFYQEFATTLLSFKSNRSVLIDKIYKTFKAIGIKLAKLDNVDPSADMDPFTVFGLFNKNMTDKNRLSICSEIKNQFGLQSTIPTDFVGIPTLNPQNATFYPFVGDSKRGANDIDHLWFCFDSALEYADQPSVHSEEKFIEAYDAVKDIKGNRWKLTMALYWVRPYTFLSLDSTSRSFLSGNGNIDDVFAEQIKALKNLPDGTTYLSLCKKCAEVIHQSEKYHNFVELSFGAWNVSARIIGDTPIDPIIGAALGDQDVRTVHYWLYSPGGNAAHWETFRQEGIIALSWG